jgi:hypothetical protein
MLKTTLRVMAIALALTAPAPALNDSTTVLQQWPAAKFNNSNDKYAGIYMWSPKNGFCQYTSTDTGGCFCDLWSGYWPVLIWAFDSSPDNKFYAQGAGYMEMYQCVKFW